MMGISRRNETALFGAVFLVVANNKKTLTCTSQGMSPLKLCDCLVAPESQDNFDCSKTYQKCAS